MATDVKDLLLRIDASTELLRKNMDLAEREVGDFEKIVERELTKVEQRFSQLKGANLSNSVRAIKEDFRKNFSEIQKIAAQAIEAPRLKGGGLDLGVGDAKAAAAAAQQQAVALRLIADAAERAAAGETELSRATDVQVRAARAAATQAELNAAQLAKQAGALERIQIETNLAAQSSGVLHAAQSRATVSAGQQRSGYQQLSYQIGDVATQFSLGAKPMMIFAAQGAQVVQAIGMIRGTAGGLIGFLSGPWGAVMLGAVTVLGSLAFADDKASDAKKKHKDAADDLRDAVDRLNNAERAASETTRQGIIDSMNAASAYADRATKARAAAVAELELARSKVQAAMTTQRIGNGGLPGTVGSVASAQEQAARAEYATISKQISDLNGAIQFGARGITNGAAQLIQRSVEARNDPRAAVEQRFSEAKDAAIRSFQRTKDDRAYQAALDQATKERDASLKLLDKNSGRTRSTAAAERRAARSDARYEDDKDNLAVAGLRAQADYSGEIDDRLNAELAAMDAQLESYKRRLSLDENLSDAKRNELAQAQEAVTVQEKANAERRAADDKARERFQLETAANQATREVLEAQLDLAMGREEERAIQRRILMLKQSQERAEQEMVLASNTATAAQKSIALALLKQMEARQAAEQAGLELRYSSPMEQYRRSIAQNRANLGDAIESIQVDALDQLNNGLVDAIMNADNLADVFSNVAKSIVADLIRIAIQQTIVANLMNAIGSVFGLGGNPLSGSLSAANDNVAKLALNVGKGSFASGGYTGNLPRDQVAGIVHGQEFVFDADAVSRIGRSQLEAIRSGSFRAPSMSSSMLASARSGGGAVRIEVAEGALFEPRVSAISGNVAVSVVRTSAPTLVAASVGESRSDAVRSGRRRIPGRS